MLFYGSMLARAPSLGTGYMIPTRERLATILKFTSALITCSFVLRLAVSDEWNVILIQFYHQVEHELQEFLYHY